MSLTSTQARDLAIDQARSDPAAGHNLALAIAEPWFRAQALAWVAWLSPAESVVALADESVSAALSAVDPYQAVGGAAWPIRALAERGHPTEALDALGRVLPLLSRIANPVSRLDALFLLWQAIFPLDNAARTEVLERLVNACAGADSWKAGTVLRDAVLMLAQEDPFRAQAVADRMPEGKYRRQTERRLAAREFLDPRPFFWRH